MLRFGHAEQAQCSLHGFRTLLAKRQVVFAAAALVGVALDQHLVLAVLGEKLGMVIKQRFEFVLDDETVVVEINAALGERAFWIFQGGGTIRVGT